MNTYIALLRGINVGGHRKLPMTELRYAFSDAGMKYVKTYIQSGNVVFKSTELQAKVLEHMLNGIIKTKFGLDVPVMVKTRESLLSIFNKCPFQEEEKAQSYFIFLKDSPPKLSVEEASKKTYPYERFFIGKDCIYLFPSKGYGNSKFNIPYFEKILQTEATARNYNTVLKLVSLSDN